MPRLVPFDVAGLVRYQTDLAGGFTRICLGERIYAQSTALVLQCPAPANRIHNQRRGLSPPLAALIAPLDSGLLAGIRRC